MKPPTIGIVAGEFPHPVGGWVPHICGQGQTYIDAVIRAGGLPIILPLTDNEPMWPLYYDMCDGLLLAGGPDLNPACYGEGINGTRRGVDSRRDVQELGLAKLALAQDRPILGICRGHQLMNVALGGTLIQDISLQVPGAEDHEASTHSKNMAHIAHSIDVEAGSLLARILGVTTMAANTHHHQAVGLLGRGLVGVASTGDGIIKGLELPGHTFAVGVQLHPEALEAEVEPGWRQLFGAYVAAAA